MQEMRCVGAFQGSYMGTSSVLREGLQEISNYVQVFRETTAARIRFSAARATGEQLSSCPLLHPD